MTTEEGNKIIAEFMGWKSDKYGHLPNKLHKIENDKEISIHINNLEYHSSWDWLMPVWAKLGEGMYKIRREISEQDYNQAGIFTINILKAFQKVDINAAFNWIVESIQWYEKTLKTQTP